MKERMILTVKRVLNRVSLLTSKDVNKIIGYTLLSPAFVSVFMFFSDIVLQKLVLIKTYHEVSISKEIEVYPYLYMWSHSDGYTSHIVLFIGMMAVVGAYLVRNSDK